MVLVYFLWQVAYINDDIGIYLGHLRTLQKINGDGLIVCSLKFFMYFVLTELINDDLKYCCEFKYYFVSLSLFFSH